MIHKTPLHHTVLSILLTAAALLAPSASPAKETPGGSGGGEKYTQDFVRVATREVYPWLKLIGGSMTPKMDAQKFLLAVDSTKMMAVDQVFESCRFSVLNSGKQTQSYVAVPQGNLDPEREACYNGHGFIFISKSKYELNKIQSVPQRRLVAHEIFRKMGVEGNGYELSNQMNTVPVSKTAVCDVFGKGASTNPNSMGSEPQETEVELQDLGTMRTLHFNRFEVEVWGIPRELPRIRIYDTVTHAAAEGRIDSTTGEGMVHLLGSTKYGLDTLALVTCTLK